MTCEIVKSVRICRKTDDLFGSHIGRSAPGRSTARLACIRKVQKEWDEKQRKPAGIPWKPPTPNFHLKWKTSCDRCQVQLLEKRIQINVVKELSDNERARLAAHLALVWHDVSERKS